MLAGARRHAPWVGCWEGRAATGEAVAEAGCGTWASASVIASASFPGTKAVTAAAAFALFQTVRGWGASTQGLGLADVRGAEPSDDSIRRNVQSPRRPDVEPKLDGLPVVS